MRSKEISFDYRYFCDPDLVPIKISQETKNRIKSEIPEMPFEKQERFFAQYKLPYTVTSVICKEKALSDLFEDTVAIHNNPITTANFIANEMLREMSNDQKSIDDISSSTKMEDHLKISPKMLSGLVKLIDDGVLSKQIASEVFVEMFRTGKSAEEIVEENTEA